MQVAGITLTRKNSPILSISGPIEKSCDPIMLGIKAISATIRYGKKYDDIRISILFHDGNTIIRGVAFGDAARKFKNKLKVGRTYIFRNHKIEFSDQEYTNTKYELYLWEHTIATIKTIAKGYTESPKVKGKKISEINEMYKNLLITTSKVRISKVCDLLRPKYNYLRKFFVTDEKEEIQVLMWSFKEVDFPFSVGDIVILRYMTVKYDDQHIFLKNSDNTKIVRCRGK